jgi:hypothetical protein
VRVWTVSVVITLTTLGAGALGRVVGNWDTSFAASGVVVAFATLIVTIFMKDCVQIA